MMALVQIARREKSYYFRSLSELKIESHNDISLGISQTHVLGVTEGTDVEMAG